MRPILDNSILKRGWIAFLALIPSAVLTACQRAPSFSIAGSFFPDWIFCCLIGILVTVVAYRLFVGLKMEREVQPAILIYPCIALSSAVTLWLLFFD
jgi:YtcA family